MITISYTVSSPVRNVREVILHGVCITIAYTVISPEKRSDVLSSSFIGRWRDNTLK